MSKKGLTKQVMKIFSDQNPQKCLDAVNAFCTDPKYTKQIKEKVWGFNVIPIMAQPSSIPGLQQSNGMAVTTVIVPVCGVILEMSVADADAFINHEQIHSNLILK